jgi:N-acetylmuramoyl-L-alanine amidase
MEPAETHLHARVVIDPGHGGDDWGVDPVDSGLREKEVVLDIARRLQQQLEARGAEVYVTRTTDRFISLQARVRFGNAHLFRPDNDPTVGRFISLHVNSNREQPALQRVEVLVDPEAEVPSFAVAMAEALAQATGGGFGYRDVGYPPGVHPADIASVRWTYPRGHNVLSESAFLSNPVQAAQLRDPVFLESIAHAHAVAVEQALGSMGQ